MADKKHLKLVSSNDDLKDKLKASLELEPPAPCEGEDMLIALLDQAGHTVEVEVEFEDCSGEVIDFEVERAFRQPLENHEVTPATVLKMALEDVTTGPYQNCAKVYVTLILDRDKTFSTCNYRANLSRIEEVAFRQLGVAESIDGWRGVTEELMKFPKPKNKIAIKGGAPGKKKVEVPKANKKGSPDFQRNPKSYFKNKPKGLAKARGKKV